MKKFLTSICAAALVAATAATSSIPAAAMPLTPVDDVQNSDVVQVQDGYIVRRNGQTDRQRQFFGDTGGREYRNGDYGNGIYRDLRRDDRRDRREFRRDRRDDRRDDRRGFYRDNGFSYYNGHRGYRSHRSGYREYNGLWFPLAAFAAGAVVSGAINSDPGPDYDRGGGDHVQWCYDRYRSYRASDITFQPYNGGRHQCYSPYS